MASCDEGAPPMTPARLTASTEPSLLQSGIQIVSTVIGPDLHGGSSDGPTRPARCEWIAALCLTAAVALLLVAGGIFYWRSTASAKHSLPEAPPAATSAVDITMMQ